jgi:hypothetical protein
MARADSPAWRRAFDGVEKRVSPPLVSTTSSADFQATVLFLRRAKRAIERPIEDAASWGLHLVGLPSRADMRDLKKQLGDVQREMLALRRDLVSADESKRKSR